MGDTQRCATCKHWVEYGLQRLGESGYPSEGDAPGTWGTCQLVALFGPHRASDKFYVIDGSLYSASLNTRDDFGCVEHEVRLTATGDE